MHSYNDFEIKFICKLDIEAFNEKLIKEIYKI